MPNIHHLVRHLQNGGLQKQRLLYGAALMIFFFALSDSTLTFTLPLLIKQSGFSDAVMGLIIGSSSLAGAVFDIIAGRVLRNPHYRRLYLAALILVGVFGLLLFQAKLIWVYLIAMVIWGVYWDIFHFANYDFVSRIKIKENDEAEFGVIEVFKALGNLLGPIGAGLVIGAVVGFQPFLMAAACLAAALVFYFTFIFKSDKSTKQQPIKRVEVINSKSWWDQLLIWRNLGHQLMPFIFFMLLLNIVEAFFWTIGPLLATSDKLGHFGGFLLAAYVFPSLIMGWLAGRISIFMGRKKTVFVVMLIGSLLLSIFGLVNHGWLMVGLVLLLATCFSLAFPMIEGVCADYIAKNRVFEKEIQGFIDIFYNLGWIIGPIFAGFSAQLIGQANSFSLLGVLVFLSTIAIAFFSKGREVNNLN